MQDGKENFDRSSDKTKKIMVLIVAPILFLIAGLIIITSIDQEKPTLIEVMSEIDIQCYNVNWFGVHGFQVIYKESVEEIITALAEHDIEFSEESFFKDLEVVDYVLVACPHVDSTLEVPEIFDPNIGVNVLDKCLQKKVDTIDFQDYCAGFIT